MSNCVCGHPSKVHVGNKSGVERCYEASCDCLKFLERRYGMTDAEAITLGLCVKCGGGAGQHATNCPQFQTDNIELSLLVIDMGDSCAVKVEKGEIGLSVMFPLLLKSHGNVGVTPHPFADARAAIDASYVIESPPVPRIERYDSKSHPYRLRNPWGVWTDLTDATYDCLSRLAGKPLPIWEPKQHGEWSLLKGSEHPGLKIYRYVRIK